MMAMYEISRFVVMWILMLMSCVHVSQCCSSSAQQDERDAAGDNTTPDNVATSAVKGVARLMTYIVSRLRYEDLKMKFDMNIRYLHVYIRYLHIYV